MKKSITLILAAGFLFAIVFSCSNSNEGFESGIKPNSPSNAQEKAFCYVPAKDEPCSKMEISKELCIAIGGDTLKPDQKCAGKYGIIPNFTCGWTPEIVARNDTAVLSFVLENRDPNCTSKAFYVNSSSGDTVDFKLDSNYVISDTYYSSLGIYGYLECKDETDTSIREGSTKDQPQLCDSYEMSPVPTPRIRGELKINVDDSDSSYYYIGTQPTIITYIEITNKEAAECGEIEYTWTNRTPTDTGMVKVVATAVCNGTERELASVTATRVPDPVLSDCVWDRTDTDIVMDSISPTRRRVPIMHEEQTLKVSATLSNSYGRCGPNVLYSFNGAAESVDSSLSLSGLANRGQSSASALSAKAVAPCPRNTIADKICVGVDSIYVAYHVEKKGSCGDNEGTSFAIKSGINIFEFACEGEKNPANKDDLYNAYYINCDGNEGNFTVAAEGGTVQGSGHNGWNFIGQTVSKDPVDGLYHYPVPALIRTSVSAGLTCKIW
jgi:hypothetical protein